MSNSILTTIKKLCNLGEEYTPFDPDVIVHINKAFAKLKQVGAGPAKGYRIKGIDNAWSEFISDEDDITLDMAKDYIYIECKLIFDPPASATIAQILKEEKEELLERIKIECESKSV